MAEAHERAREDLHGWQHDQPKNFFRSNHQLERLLRAHLGPERFAARERHFEAFGAVVAGELDAAAIVNNREGNLPRLDRYSPYGVRTEGIEKLIEEAGFKLRYTSAKEILKHGRVCDKPA